MTVFSLPHGTDSSRASINHHPVHRATALLRESLHDSRRATFTREFGEIRGIHRLSPPPVAEVLLDEAIAFHPDEPRQPIEDTSADLCTPHISAEEPPVGNPSAQKQLRGLVHDFRERQRQAGLIVAGSIATAATLTLIGGALLFLSAAT